MDKEEKLVKFVKELEKLTKKYGVSIGGCGCCNSPYASECDINGYYEYIICDDMIDSINWKVRK